MSVFTALFNEVLFRPFFNILILFYNLTGDFGVAIILLTLSVRFILHPFSAKALKSQQELAKLQPLVQEIQRKYKNNQTEQSKELMRLYREHGVNPFAGCLPLIIQLPVFIALFAVLRRGLEPQQISQLYSFIGRPTELVPLFLGFVNLQSRSILMAFGAGVLQWLQSKSAPAPAAASGSFASSMSTQMVYVLPVIIFVVSVTLPAGIALYLLVSTAFSVLQQYFSNRKNRV